MAMARTSRGARIRTLCTSFGGSLLSQEHTPICRFISPWVRVCPGSLNGRLVGCSVSTEFGKVRRFGAHRAPYEDLPRQALSHARSGGRPSVGRPAGSGDRAERRRVAAHFFPRNR